MLALNEELDAITSRTMDVGQKMREVAQKRDKLLPRERINAVLDKGSPFLEIGQLAGYDPSDDENNVPSGNIIAGIGLIGGRQCMILANNYSYKGGAYYPITVKKHLRA
jgi:3-methylcrotonyl-CoA carboxylase beta subunit